MRLVIRENRTSAPRLLMARAFGALICLMSALGAPGSDQPTDLQRIATCLRSKSLHMPDDVAPAYRSVFRNNDGDMMASLLNSESPSIALKAAWRLAELKWTERPDSNPLSRFLGYVEGRTKTKLPKWWEACVLASRFDFDDRSKLRPGGWPEVDEELFPIRRIEFGDDLLSIPPGVEVTYDGDSLVWKTDDATTRVPRNLMHMENVRSTDWATMHLSADRIYFAIGSEYDGSFGLACLRPDGKEVWRANGWGTGMLRGGASGVWWSASEIACTGEEI